MNKLTPEIKDAMCRIIAYPEHEKLKALNGANNTVAEFLEFLREQDYVLAKWYEDDLRPQNPDTGLLISKFFNIDLDALEAEKEQMLASLRSAQ